MNFNIKHNFFAFSTVTSVKRWALDWAIAAVACDTVCSSQHDNAQQIPTQVAYGLLVRLE